MDKILHNDEAIKAVQRGVNKVCNAVKITLGPLGRNVIVNNGNTPLITNDGVTIAKAIELEDKGEKAGAEILKEVCIKTNLSAGDGTTTACVLAGSIINDGIKSIMAGSNPVELKKGLQKGLKAVITDLNKISKPICGSEDLKQIATISCQNEILGEIIAKAFTLVGQDGIISVQEGKKLETELEEVKGVSYDRGYISPVFCTDIVKQVVEFDDVLLLLWYGKLNNLNEILPILEKVLQSNRPLVIMASEYSEEFITSLAINKMRGGLKVAAVKAPAYGSVSLDYLEDLAAIGGGVVFGKDSVIQVNEANLSHLCNFKKCTISKIKINLIEGFNDEKRVQQRIESIKASLEDYENDSVLTERLSKLSGGATIIRIGYASDVEAAEMKLRIEDAINATRSALKEGTVIGGGCALIKCKNTLNSLINQLKDDEKIGAQILLNTLEAPIRQIAANAGVDEGFVLCKISDIIEDDYGYNALNGKFCNLRECGIIDPTLVTRSALTNAVSVASTLLTTSCIIN